MVPVLGRVASGMRQGAWVERHQDLDTSAKCSAVSLTDLNDAPGTRVRLGIAGLNGGGTQWCPLSAAVDQPCMGNAVPGPRSALQAADEADRAE